MYAYFRFTESANWLKILTTFEIIRDITAYKLTDYKLIDQYFIFFIALSQVY